MHSKSNLSLLFAILIITSGCLSSADNPTTSPSPSEQATAQTPTSASSPTGTASRTPTARPTATPSPTPAPPQNPWKKEPIVIGIDDSADPDRNYSAQVIEAVEYWHTNGGTSTAWSPNFTVRPDANTPDIVIRFVNEIPTCGRDDDDGVAVGCASVLDSDSNPSNPEVVLVNLGLTNESTYRVVRHELGHILGLYHGEGAEGVMTRYTDVFDQIVRVHIEFETTAEHEKRDTRRQLGYVFEYYSGGADGFLSESVEFALIEDRGAADVKIQINKGGGESKAYSEGDAVVIEVNGILTGRRGWHVGYWFGYYFGATSISELPPPFDEPETDPRTQWWH